MRKRKSKRSRKTTRRKTWTLIPIFGLLLSGFGALGVIELRSQVAVIPEEAIEPGQPFSAPFRVENTGYSSIYIVRIYFYVHYARLGQMQIKRAIMSDDLWARIVLDREEAQSLSTHFWRSPGPPDEADIVVAVDVKSWNWLPFTERRYFRFTRFEGPYYGIWTWLPQPSGEFQSEVDEQIERYRDEHEKAR